MSTKIAIVGLGYVGLPLGLQFARSGVAVLGLDIDSAKVKALTEGRNPLTKRERMVLVQAKAGGSIGDIPRALSLSDCSRRNCARSTRPPWAHP